MTDSFQDIRRGVFILSGLFVWMCWTWVTHLKWVSAYIHRERETEKERMEENHKTFYSKGKKIKEIHFPFFRRFVLSSVWVLQMLKMLYASEHSSLFLLLLSTAFHSTPPGTHIFPASFFHPNWDPTPPNIRPHVRGTRGYIFLFQPGTPASWALNSISHFKSSTKSNWNTIILFIIYHPK